MTDPRSNSKSHVCLEQWALLLNGDSASSFMDSLDFRFFNCEIDWPADFQSLCVIKNIQHNI